MKNQIITSLQKITNLEEINLEFSSRPEFGDYTTNIALMTKNPRAEAEKIVEKLNKDKSLKEIIERIDIAGPGFINFHLSKKALLTNLSQVVEEKDKYGASNEGKGETVLVEYSSPQIAKRMGIGHLRSTIIGQALYNLYKFLGYKVVGENHLGDWGTPFGMLIYEIVSKKLDLDSLNVEKLEQIYIEFNQKLESDPQLRNEAKEWFKKLENGDQLARKVWEKMREVSLSEYDKIYKLLGVNIENLHGESFYEDKMNEIVLQAKKNGLAKEGQNGALIVEFPDMSPAMLLKGDHTTTYFTRDLAAIRFRAREWNPKIIIYEVGVEQSLHFRQVFKAAKLLGLVKENVELKHIPHGLYLDSDGKKFSTRKGKTVKLEEVLDEAVEKAKEFNSDPEVSTQVGIGAIKYFDLMHAPTSDINFDWNKIFVLEGNSGPYLQYTYARTHSVLAKAKENYKLQDDITLSQEELSVIRYLFRFPETISMSTKIYSPNILAEYLFNLARVFNTFYNKHKIIGSKEEDFRLILTAATGQVLKNGLTLLGIATPEKM